MDFGNAALLASTVFLVVELIKQVFPKITSREKVIVAILSGQASTLLVANSDWGVKQVIDGIKLNSMNTASLVLVGLALSGLAIVGKQALTAISNIGENQK